MLSAVGLVADTRCEGTSEKVLQTGREAKTGNSLRDAVSKEHSDFERKPPPRTAASKGTGNTMLEHGSYAVVTELIPCPAAFEKSLVAGRVTIRALREVGLVCRAP
jgi:hypothetical protein